MTNPDNDNKPESTPQEIFELWKHFESVGGNDKDRMVSIVTWLLAFAAAVLAYIGTKDINFESWSVENPIEAVFFSILGMFICAVSGFLVYAFGVHANRYWYRADLLINCIPDLRDFFLESEDLPIWGRRKYYRKFIKKVGHSHDPKEGLALVFKVFLWFTGFLFYFFLLIIVLSAIEIFFN